MKPKAIVLTGASSGLGLELVQHWQSRDEQVVTLQRSTPAFNCPNLHHIPCDLLDEEELMRSAAEISAAFDVVGLVNNAGSGGANPIENVDWDHVDRLNRLHLKASLLLTQCFVSNMKANGFGRIVNVGSRAILGKEGRTAYATSKAALLSATRVWAMELGPSGITVNMVAPGPLNVGLFAKHTPPGSEKLRKIESSIPVRRIGQAADVIHAIDFFLSPHAGYITGQVLYVCGGLSVSTSPI